MRIRADPLTIQAEQKHKRFPRAINEFSADKSMKSPWIVLAANHLGVVKVSAKKRWSQVMKFQFSIFIYIYYTYIFTVYIYMYVHNMYIYIYTLQKKTWSLFQLCKPLNRHHFSLHSKLSKNGPH